MDATSPRRAEEGLRAISRGAEPHRTWAGDRGAGLQRALGEAFASNKELARPQWRKPCIRSSPKSSSRPSIRGRTEFFPCFGKSTSRAGWCRVVAFTGDAGLLMVISELSTLTQLKIPLIAIVFVDASLSFIEMKQRARQMTNPGVDVEQHDSAAIAAAFGGVGVTVSDRPLNAAAAMRWRSRMDSPRLLQPSKSGPIKVESDKPGCIAGCGSWPHPASLRPVRRLSETLKVSRPNRNPSIGIEDE